uniref:acetyl-CoA C-acetyltransferase n=1 Tax=Macrostomum lignano TaxID=282301 RepID=A0A1I8FS36_9PLAT
MASSASADAGASRVRQHLRRRAVPVDQGDLLDGLDDDGADELEDEDEEDEPPLSDADADSEEAAGSDDDDAIFRGGELDEAEQEELLAMEAEEADGSADDEEDSEAEADLAARFDREDLPFDSLKFDDFIDPAKRPGNETPDEEEEEEETGERDDDEEPEEAGEARPEANARGDRRSLEDSLVRPAPWQLRGEIEAAERPEGGLLEEDLDFDHIGRPRPLASEELESRIQELVRARIKEAKFDSVARKHRPEERPAEYRKALLLDTEKPRPLAEVYEGEFAKQQTAEAAKSLPQHEEIRRDLNSLLARLDRLSGLHFAPQNPLPASGGAPALAMEEVRGTAASAEASQAAPEQLADKPGRRAGKEVGDSELSRTDRLRRRARPRKASGFGASGQRRRPGIEGSEAGGSRAAQTASAKTRVRRTPLLSSRRLEPKPTRQPQEVFIVSGARTPIGSFRKALSALTAPALGSVAIREAVRRSGLAPSAVTEVYMGNVCQAAAGQAPARQAALGAGLEESTPCTTVNKVCASGLKAAMLASQSLALGHNDVMVAGGMESMSRVPFYLERKDRPTAAPSCWTASSGARLGVGRQDQDEYATASYQKGQWAAAREGLFKAELVPVTIKDKRGDSVVADDEEYARTDKDGTITAANASTLNDGAARCCWRIRAGLEQNSSASKPLARVVGYADAATAPADFGIAPAWPSPSCCSSDVAMWEINEAFSAVAIACQRNLNIPPERLNVHGGAVAIGHPIGMSGARILLHLACSLRPGERGVAAICNGGGGASAMMIER